MTNTNHDFYKRAHEILVSLLGEGATFREGQYEAIEATMTRPRTLVVQRTGWGKSLIYFICTRLMRERGRGATIVVSPLLILMKNQLESATRLGLRCEVLNKTTVERQGEIMTSLKKNELDLVLVTPETLFKEDIREEFKKVDIGLFVVDEAHCISDWGHDFRPEYCRLREVIRELSTDTPLLATTATANNRVIEDLCEQLGDEVYISRGPLTRESLSIRLLHMPSRAERYGWILENINKLNGSGIIYCLTRRDCDYLADFLTKNGVSAVAYYSDPDRDEINAEAERKFENNEIKAIVATIKLGMGYDKGDVSFIIHYQMPSGIVSYYQQIGRAGRSIPNADVFLMYGKEDMTIIDYFIDTIFPLKEDVDAIMALCKSEERVKARKIERELNISKRRIERTLEYLLANDIITLDRHAYSLTGKELSYDREKYDAIEAQRRAEAEQMRALATHKGCYSKYIVNCLDDFSAEDCGKCGFCNPKYQISDTVSLEFKEKASHYINRLVLEITPRKMWAVSEQMPSSKIEFVNQEGICLCEYSEVGYGELVRRAIEGDTYFPPELLGKSAELLLPLIKDKEITHLAYVPSKRSDRVAEFASRLAKRCAIELICPLEAKDAPRQCEMENGAHKCENALNAFLVKTEHLPEKIILLDDTVDSKWTLTVCGYKLMEKGATEVYPFVLAHKGERQ